MRCPTLDDITSATLALLPRGRAWQTDDAAPSTESFLWQFWRSFAVMVYFVTQRLCALRHEFWCQTLNETRDEWMTEYGLPDACDPFPDLCTKVAAIGGTRCEYYAQIAARSGWDIDCVEALDFCGGRMGRAKAGCFQAGGTTGKSVLKIIVHLPSSPAYQPIGRYLPSLAGRMRSGRRQSCGPDLSPIQCIISRIVHAEILTTYEVSNV